MTEIIKQLIIDHYRCHPESLDFISYGTLKDFAQGLPCYGRTVGYTCPSTNMENAQLQPFDPAQVVSLRYERYVDYAGPRKWSEGKWIKKIYYMLRPLFPVSLRKYFQQL